MRKHIRTCPDTKEMTYPISLQPALPIASYMSSTLDSFRLSLTHSGAAERLAALRHLQQEGTLCDVALETEEGERIPAHRVVLSASSPFFRAMFASGLAESTQKVVRLPDIEMEVLAAVVTYAYCGDVSLPDADQVAALLSASDRLQVRPLLAECCRYLRSRLRPDNCLRVRAVADMHGCEELSRACTEYALDNFEEVAKSDDYLHLPCSQLRDLISRDEVRVSGEEQVYAAVMRWVRHDLPERRASIPEVMSLVRLPLVSNSFLAKVESEELLDNEVTCQSLIAEARLYKSSPERRSHIIGGSPCRGRPRKSSGVRDVLLAVGGMSKDHALSSVEQYDPRAGLWSPLTDLIAPRYGHAACHLGGYLYVVGGYSEGSGGGGGGYLACAERYDLRGGRWEVVAPLLTARRYHSIEVLHGLIYVTGGQSERGVTNLTECYNPEHNTWTPISPLLSTRMYHGTAVVGGTLLVVGGHDGFRRLSSAEIFNPYTGQWVMVASMTSPRSVVGVATVREMVFVAGGYNGCQHLNTLEHYDGERDQWSQGPPMVYPRSALGLVAYDGCLYACGGYNGSITSSVEILSPGNHRWEPAESMNMARIHFGMTCT